ncbi:MAG: hypothetical protein ACLU8F_01025 [Clostridia bacterium]
MTMKQQELYNVIESLPEELSIKAFEYIEYLKFMYAFDKAPSNLIIKSDKDLLTKLQKGMKDTEEGKVCSVEEAFKEVNKILLD